jgi:hypothetical protein
MARAKVDVREERIIMEAVVDAYGPEERAMGWYYYLDNKLKVPFKARCRVLRPISILKVGEEVEVLGIAPGGHARRRFELSSLEGALRVSELCESPAAASPL